MCGLLALDVEGVAQVVYVHLGEHPLEVLVGDDAVLVLAQVSGEDHSQQDLVGAAPHLHHHLAGPARRRVDLRQPPALGHGGAAAAAAAKISPPILPCGRDGCRREKRGQH